MSSLAKVIQLWEAKSGFQVQLSNPCPHRAQHCSWQGQRQEPGDHLSATLWQALLPPCAEGLQQRCLSRLFCMRWLWILTLSQEVGK